MRKIFLFFCIALFSASCSSKLQSHMTVKKQKNGLYLVTIRKGFEVKQFLTDCNPDSVIKKHK